MMRHTVVTVLAAILVIGACGDAANPKAQPDQAPQPTSAASRSPLPTAASAAPTSTDGASMDIAPLPRPRQQRWRPSGPTALIEERVEDRVRIWAVPLRSNAAGPDGSSDELLEVRDLAGGWAVSADGSMFVLALATRDASRKGTRLAAWDARQGSIRWITPAGPPGTSVSFPVISLDGGEVYFARSVHSGGGAPTDDGIWRVRSDGSGLAQVRAGGGGLGTQLHGITPDGLGLVWGRLALEGANVLVLDLAGGVERALPCCLARVEAWRSKRPRALLTRHGGDPASSSLVLWDDLAPSSERVLVARNATVAGADWDPGLERLVAAVGPASGPQRLAILDAEGRVLREVPGTEGAARPIWEPEGIAYVQWLPYEVAPGKEILEPREVRFVDPNGATIRPSFRGRGMVQLVAVVR